MLITWWSLFQIVKISFDNNCIYFYFLLVWNLLLTHFVFFSFGFYGQRIGCWCKGCCHQWYRISLYCLPWFGHEATRSSILGHSILCHVIHLGLGLSIRHCGNHFVWSYGFPTFLEKIQNLFSGCYLYNWFYLWITSDNKSK